MAASLALRRALLVLDMQNEFLAPAGRCEIVNPSFVDNVLAFASAFRQTGIGDIIWVRTEFDKPRDANDEKILLYEEETQEDKMQRKEQGGEGAEEEEDQIGKTDEYLSTDTNPYCAKGSWAAEFHESVMAATKTAGDRTLRKTWYSAFQRTSLVEILRGRLATELFICGIKTNVSVYATASDAVSHGFKVTVLSDCVGFSDQKLHDTALSDMAGVLGCEVIRSAIMVKSWAAKKKPVRTKSTPASASKEELAKMIENLALNGAEGGNATADNYESEDGSKKDTEASSQNVSDTPTKTRSGKHKKQGSPHKSSAAETSESAQQMDKIQETNVRKPNHLKEPQHVQANHKKEPLPPITEDDYEGSPEGASPKIARKIKNVPTVLKEGDVMGEGDTLLVAHFLPADLGDTAFERLKREVRWRTMLHRGGEVPRLVAVEGDVNEDGSFPIYRHPADESPPLRPFSPTVSLIRDQVQKVLKHPVNHALIQYYRDGNDYISEHSDKTLDIVRGSNIVNVSLGAQRTMLLRAKKDPKEWLEYVKGGGGKEKASEEVDRRLDGKPGAQRTIQRIPLPHNSMFVLGELTNRKWLHAIKQDKRLPTMRSPEESLCGGERISLTFRHIGTFVTDDETKIWGQGATCKERKEAKPINDKDQTEVEKLIYAFGTENHQADEFDWDGVYGGGFDVLHFKTRLPRLYYSNQNTIGVTRVLLALSEKGVDIEVEESKDSSRLGDEDDITIMDSDIDRTTVKGSIQILLYLETFYTGSKAMGGVGKSLFPKAQRHERGPYANVLETLFESERLRTAFEEYKKATASSHGTKSQPLSPQSGPETTAKTDSQSRPVSPPDNPSTATTKPTVSPALTHFRFILDALEHRLHRISLGTSGPALGETIGQENICFGGIDTSSSWSVADCAIWPVLRMIEDMSNQQAGERRKDMWKVLEEYDGQWTKLRKYYHRGLQRGRVRRVLAGEVKKQDYVATRKRDVTKTVEKDEEEDLEKKLAELKIEDGKEEVSEGERQEVAKTEEGIAVELKPVDEKPAKQKPAGELIQEKPTDQAPVE